MRKKDIFKTVKNVAGQKGVTAQEISEILGLNKVNDNFILKNMMLQKRTKLLSCQETGKAYRTRGETY